MEHISPNEEHNVLLLSYQTQINQRITYNFICMKGERQRIWGEEELLLA